MIFKVKVQGPSGSWSSSSTFFVAATSADSARAKLRLVYPEFRERPMIVDDGVEILLMTLADPFFTKVS